MRQEKKSCVPLCRSRIARLLLVIVLSRFGVAQAEDAKGKPPTGPANSREAIAELDKVGAIYEKDADGNIVGILIGGDSTKSDMLLCLKMLPRLKKVEIRCARNVNDEGLATLGELSDLKTLWLEYVPITDQGMKHLSKLANLEDLFLGPYYKSNLTDDGLLYLKDLKSLRKLTCSGHVHVSDKAVNRLRADLPNCEIELRREIKEKVGPSAGPEKGRSQYCSARHLSMHSIWVARGARGLRERNACSIAG
jgi:hypothetical protein